MARVFIGIPTYNRPDYVRETVESLLAQSFTDWRAIVSDNASPDTSTTEAVKAFVDELGDPRVEFSLRPENGGEYGQGRFFFGALGDEDYFMILHDDDLLFPDYLRNGIETLDRESEAAFYFADPEIIGPDGAVNADSTEWYKDYHGRRQQPEGLLDVLSHHLRSGIAPICATLIRSDTLRKSGFVDEGMTGNFPFEINVFLRLGELGTQAYYAPRKEIAFRFHPGALRKDGLLMRNEQVVRSMIQLFEKRSYGGDNEKRRRILLARCYRALAVIEADKQTSSEVRPLLRAAFSTRPSAKNGFYFLLGMISPGLVRRVANLFNHEIANPA